MSEINDGGPAFPVPFDPGATTGMTLRDYFAAMAMQGDWASQKTDSHYYDGSTDDLYLKNAAKLYYRMADIMIKARSQKSDVVQEAQE